MKLIKVRPRDLVIATELKRSGQSKQFEERLQASIKEVGLAEPLKVASARRGKYLIVDGMMRWRAIQAIRAEDRRAFPTVPAYVVDYAARFEVRFQSDIYQDLLPSQLATLVEHLHRSENITKSELARYIGVTPPTLRNYTGVWRLLQRGGLFARVVELMDVGVVPSSNPFAWLRLTDEGIAHVLRTSFSQGEDVERWIANTVESARARSPRPCPLKFIEDVTGRLDARFYREDREVREMKRHLGRRRAIGQVPVLRESSAKAIRNLRRVERETTDVVLRTVSAALASYLR